jgi:RsiW-degrading membrane proteinase PrsW (M82 family)
MDLLKLISLAIAPVFAVIIYVYYRDKYDKEPLILLVKLFFWGCLSVIPAIILEKIAGNIFMSVPYSLYSVALLAFVGIGFSEEFSKFIFVKYFAYKSPHFNEPFDGIVYSVMVSMGFAAVENIMYVLKGGYTVGWLRMFTAVPAHACFGILMGYYFGIAKFSGSLKWLFLLNGLILAAILHGAYDYFLILRDYEGLAIFSMITLLISILFSFKAMKKLKNKSPFNSWKIK